MISVAYTAIFDVCNTCHSHVSPLMFGMSVVSFLTLVTCHASFLLHAMSCRMFVVLLYSQTDVCHFAIGAVIIFVICVG